MKYRNVFIDLDDTLWDFKSSSAVALKNLYDKYDLDRLFPSFEEFRGLYMRKNHELWEFYHHGSITKDELIVERFRFLLKQSGYQDGEDCYALELNESYLMLLSEQTLLVPYAIELLEYLKAKDYRLFVLSNGFTETQYRKLRSGGLESYFDRIVLSDEIGVTKPNPELFRYALEVTGSQIDDTLMIGDNYDADIMGARNSGWGQIYYNPENVPVTGVIPDYMVGDLRDIMTIL